MKDVIAITAGNIRRQPVGRPRALAWLAAGMLAIGVGASIVQLVDAPAADSAVAAVVLLAALVSSIAGFAFAALAGSALVWLRLEPVQAVQLTALCSIAIQTYAVWQLRSSIRWRRLLPMLGAGALTVPLGVALLYRIDPRVFAGVLGAVVTGYGGYVLLRPQARVVRGSPWRDASVGALAGVLGGLASLPGLFATIWCSLRGWDKVEQRAVYQPFILAMQLVTVACMGWAAPQASELLRLAKYVPFALLGAIGGLALFQRMTTRQFNGAVSALLAASGVGLLVRAC